MQDQQLTTVLPATQHFDLILRHSPRKESAELMNRSFRTSMSRLAMATLLLVTVVAPSQAAQRRIASRIDDTQPVRLQGHVHPQLRDRVDEGRVSPTMP